MCDVYHLIRRLNGGLTRRLGTAGLAKGLHQLPGREVFVLNHTIQFAFAVNCHCVGTNSATPVNQRFASSGHDRQKTAAHAEKLLIAGVDSLVKSPQFKLQSDDVVHVLEPLQCS